LILPDPASCCTAAAAIDAAAAAADVYNEIKNPKRSIDIRQAGRENINNAGRPKHVAQSWRSGLKQR
jgi:hypothetical protein